MIKILNSLSGKKEAVPRSSSKPLRMFVCGPTVYDESHIGHARIFLFFDSFARFLRSSGRKVFYLQNITDVDDKIINRARERGVSPFVLARRFERSYRSTMIQLGITSVTRYAPASAFIRDIVKQIQTLIKKGVAYEIPKDGWYFDISRFPEYGKLSGRTALQAEDAVSRIDETVAKRNRGDFALWKYVAVPDDLRAPRNGAHVLVNREPAWKMPIGWGRPGWHIEDTAISEHFFGPQYDLHGGANELKFPHHEAEIAQQESASGKKPFVKIWMHAGVLRVNGEKMSKSLGNFITISDFLKARPAVLLRWFVLLHHYRSPINYSDETVQQAEASLSSVVLFLSKLAFVAQRAKRARGRIVSPKALLRFERAFCGALEDDFNTPEALAAIFSLSDAVGATLWDLSRIEALGIRKQITRSLGMLGITFPESKIQSRAVQLLAKRELYRGSKQFVQADALRKQLIALGYEVEDTPLGPFALKLPWLQPKN